MSDRDSLHRFAEATRAGEDALARLRARLADEVLDPADRVALLGRLPGDDPAMVERVRTRVLSSEVPARPARSWLWIGVPLAAVAAALLLVLATATGGLALWWSTRPAAPVALVASDAWVRPPQVPQGLRVRVDGAGTVAGSASSPTFQWEWGILSLDVDPGAGLDVRISTPEGSARVVGTRLTVRRDPLGTTVAVEHGRVEVTCVAAVPVTIEGGSEHVCLPTTAEGLLGRTRAQIRSGAGPAEVLATIDAGLALPTGSASAELRVLRIQELVRARRRAEALREAEAYLASGEPLRRIDVARAAADLALEFGGCAAALPHLQLVAEDTSASSEDRARLDRCAARLPR